LPEDNQEEDILLKLSLAGKSLRISPKDAPQLPEQQPQSSQPTAPAATLTDSQPPASSSQVAKTQAQGQYQPQREVNTIVPPANTPPPTEEAQDDILRKLTMRAKDYEAPKPEISKEPSPQSQLGSISQTSAEAQYNRPYVSSEHEIEKVKELAQTIIGSDIVAKKVKK